MLYSELKGFMGCGNFFAASHDALHFISAPPLGLMETLSKNSGYQLYHSYNIISQDVLGLICAIFCGWGIGTERAGEGFALGFLRAGGSMREFSTSRSYLDLSSGPDRSKNSSAFGAEGTTLGFQSPGISPGNLGEQCRDVLCFDPGKLGKAVLRLIVDCTWIQKKTCPPTSLACLYLAPTAGTARMVRSGLLVPLSAATMGERELETFCAHASLMDDLDCTYPPDFRVVLCKCPNFFFSGGVSGDRSSSKILVAEEKLEGNGFHQPIDSPVEVLHAQRSRPPSFQGRGVSSFKSKMQPRRRCKMWTLKGYRRPSGENVDGGPSGAPPGPRETTELLITAFPSARILAGVDRRWRCGRLEVSRKRAAWGLDFFEGDRWVSEQAGLQDLEWTLLPRMYSFGLLNLMI
nr:hypothetical protein Iba_chr12eCG2480 [Ipomoea batatas]